MGIIIVILIYALIAFIMWSMLENQNNVMAFIINILGFFIYYLINNGTEYFLISLFSAIINGAIFYFIGTYFYKKETELNRFLGTTVLIGVILTIISNFLIGSIFVI